MMKIVLGSSLHLNHGMMKPDAPPGIPLPLQTFVPVGLLSLAAFVRSERPDQDDIFIKELNSIVTSSRLANDERLYDSLAEVLLADDPDLVGLMTDADSLHHTILMADALKRARPGVVTVLGGPASSPVAEDVLHRFPFVNVVVRGEGEWALADLISALDEDRPLSLVKGIAYRDGDVVTSTPDQPLLGDLDQLPLPAFDLFDTSGSDPLYLDVGRGCPFDCEFCSTAPFFKRRYRMKSAARIIDELRLLRDTYGRTHVNFAHDIFTCDYNWSMGFCSQLAEAGLEVTWTCSTRTDLVDSDLLQAMAKAGCVEIYYGIETGSQSMQTTISKNLDLDRALEVVRETVAAGIRPVTGFIVGYPEDDHVTMAETIDRFFLFLEAGGYRAHIFVLCPFQESKHYRRYRNSLNRFGEYFDLPLTDKAAEEAAHLVAEHPDLFSARYRYALTDIEEGIVDALEELSPHLANLRTLWPEILPYYSDGLDFVARWTTFITDRNRSRARVFAHCGDQRDLFDFLEMEVNRLDTTTPLPMEMLRYERAIACMLEADPINSTPVSASPPTELAPKTRLRQRSAWMAERFQHLAGNGPKPQWIVFSRRPDGTVACIPVDELSIKLLDSIADGNDLASVVSRVFGQTATFDDPMVIPGLVAVDDLIENELLEEEA
jgi:radical SAM superfamily enzyme YgiQ (UPF0313 family)